MLTWFIRRIIWEMFARVVAIATERIKNLTGHLHTHRKDQNTRRGLLQLVQNRRKMLKYLLRQSPGTCDVNVATLQL